MSASTLCDRKLPNLPLLLVLALLRARTSMEEGAEDGRVGEGDDIIWSLRCWRVVEWWQSGGWCGVMPDEKGLPRRQFASWINTVLLDYPFFRCLDELNRMVEVKHARTELPSSLTITNSSSSYQ
jgi:hypothetical protein